MARTSRNVLRKSILDPRSRQRRFADTIGRLPRAAEERGLLNAHTWLRGFRAVPSATRIALSVMQAQLRRRPKPDAVVLGGLREPPEDARPQLVVDGDVERC